MALSVGIGAMLSNATAGHVVQWFGFTTGFLYLAAIACAGLAFFALLMPATGNGRAGRPDGSQAGSGQAGDGQARSDEADSKAAAA